MTTIKDILAIKIISDGRGKRSELYLEMRRNYKSLARVVENREQSWKALADKIALAGIKDGDGKAPTLRRCQQTFYAVRRERRLASEEGRTNRTPARVLERSRPVTTDREVLARQHEFRPAKMKAEAAGVMPPHGPLGKVE